MSDHLFCVAGILLATLILQRWWDGHIAEADRRAGRNDTEDML